MSAEPEKPFGPDGFTEGGRRGAVELEASYEPDESEAARVLLMILGLPQDEVERVVANMSLDSLEEM